MKNRFFSLFIHYYIIFANFPEGNFLKPRKKIANIECA